MYQQELFDGVKSKTSKRCIILFEIMQRHNYLAQAKNKWHLVAEAVQQEFPKLPLHLKFKKAAYFDRALRQLRHDFPQIFPDAEHKEALELQEICRQTFA